MQRLEVSCAVRLIYTSIGAKGLRKLPKLCVQINLNVKLKYVLLNGQTCCRNCPKYQSVK